MNSKSHVMLKVRRVVARISGETTGKTSNYFRDYQKLGVSADKTGTEKTVTTSMLEVHSRVKIQLVATMLMGHQK